MAEIVSIKDEEVSTPEMVSFIATCILDLEWKKTVIETNLEFIRKEFLEWAYNPDKCFFAAKEDGQIVGLIMGQKNRFPFSPTHVVSEHYMRVGEYFRGKGIGKRLMDAMEGWGKEQGCKIIAMGVNAFTSKDTIGSIMAVEKMGFKVFDYTFFKEM